MNHLDTQEARHSSTVRQEAINSQAAVPMANQPAVAPMVPRVVMVRVLKVNRNSMERQEGINNPVEIILMVLSLRWVERLLLTLMVQRVLMAQLRQVASLVARRTAPMELLRMRALQIPMPPVVRTLMPLLILGHLLRIIMRTPTVVISLWCLRRICLLICNKPSRKPPMPSVKWIVILTVLWIRKNFRMPCNPWAITSMRTTLNSCSVCSLVVPPVSLKQSFANFG